MSPVVAMMQPTFLPWVGYFAMIDAADVFVFLDDFQFQRRSWHQRNRLFSDGSGDTGWWTVPVEHSGSDERLTLDAVRPTIDSAFKRTFSTRLRQAYGRSDHFEDVGRRTEAVIDSNWRSLADLNIAWIELAMEKAGIKRKTLRSSALGSDGRRSDRIVSLLRRVGADRYLAAQGSLDYMVEDGVFPVAGIETRVQSYEPVPYPQAQSQTFIPRLSMLDLLLQVGSGRALEVVRAGQREWLSWEAATGS